MPNAAGDGILVLDNVLDTVNESLLFTLSRLRPDTTIIMPVGAITMLRSQEALHITSVQDNDILNTADTMQKTTALPLTSLMLPASAAERFESDSEGDHWIAAHVALQTYAALGLERAQAVRIGGKESPSARELLARIERSRNGR